MGKGDWKRPTNKAQFDAGYERVFGKKELKRWNPEDDGLEPPEPRIGPGNRKIDEVPSGRNQRQDTEDNGPV